MYPLSQFLHVVNPSFPVNATSPTTSIYFRFSLCCFLAFFPPSRNTYIYGGWIDSTMDFKLNESLQIESCASYSKSNFESSFNCQLQLSY